MYFNPFFLASDNTESQPCKGPNGKIVEHVYCHPIYYSSFFVCNNGYLNGRQPVDFQPINIGQCIPEVYNQYRLVSASIVVKFGFNNLTYSSYELSIGKYNNLIPSTQLFSCQ